MPNCTICQRPLNQPADPLSPDCGGDCWGCISAIEAEGMGIPLEAYRRDPSASYAEFLKRSAAEPSSNPRPKP
jgi:hypothetical protein